MCMCVKMVIQIDARGVQMKRHETSYQSVTVSMFAYAAMGERSETTRDVIGISTVDRSMRENSHVQKRVEALIKSAV